MIARLAIFTLLMALIFAPTDSAEPQTTVITGATMIDCTGRPPINNAVVVIEGDKIRAVGHKGEVRIPRNARMIDATGKYILPGLIDMHVHYREWQGELFLANGITTVKDLGNPVEWISELSRMQAERRLRGPKIFYVGNNLDAPPPEGDHNVGITNGVDAERAVRLLQGFGVNAIKVRQKVTPELLAEIAKAAHARGLKVTGHLARTNATQAALAGIDGLEHATGVAAAAAQTPDQIKSDAKGVNAFYEDLKGFAMMSDEKEAALIKLLVEKKVELTPTIAVRRRAIAEDYRAMIEEDGRYANDAALAYVPEPIRKDWGEAPLDKKIHEAFSKEQMQLMRAGYQRLERFLREFHQAGGIVLAGSDNLNGVAGLTLRRELESLIAAGFSPMEALIAATKDAAHFLRRDDLGTIEAGKTADLLILGANPLADIRNLSKIEKIFQDGREIDSGFHRDYLLPPARPELRRPIFFERLLLNESSKTQ